MRSAGAAGAGLMLGDDAVMDLLEMLLHLVRSGELLFADGAGKDFSSGAFVIQKGVPLD